MSHPVYNKRVFGWSLYDFANTIYSMNILSLYLKRYIVEDLGRDGLYYDIPYALSMLGVGILMPALGALSDYSSKKKLFLMLFTAVCCMATGLISFLPATMLVFAVMIFAFSNFFYEGGMVFYNSLLYSIADGSKARVVSGIGVALGYTGSIFGMIAVLPFVSGDLFGYDIPFVEGSGKIGALLPTAILFALFSIPLMLWVKEKKELVKSGRIDILGAYRKVWEGVKETKKYPGVLRFLIADYFFEDAVATVIINIGLFSSIVLAFSDADISIFLIIATLAAMIGAYVIGLISEKMSLKNLMKYIIYGWIISLAIMLFADNKMVIYIVGSFIGVFMGGLWTVSRPLLAEFVPKEDLGRFFGLYSLSGKAAAVIGPLIWGFTVYLFKPGNYLGDLLMNSFSLTDDEVIKLSYKFAVGSLMVMMIIGLIIFRKLPDHESTK